MKLSTNTVNVLRNFAGINANIYIKKGKKLATMAVAKNIVGEIDVEENFPEDIGIFNLSEFLGVLSLMDSPEITFDIKSMTIKEGASKIRYGYADPSILVYPSKTINMPKSDIVFEVTATQVAQLQKAASTLSVQDIAFVGDGKKVTVQVLDKKNDSGNNYVMDLDAETSENFTAFFKIENLKMISDTYEITLTKGISQFKGKGLKVTYYIALEEDSSF
jgi:hypothetical protein